MLCARHFVEHASAGARPARVVLYGAGMTTLPWPRLISTDDTEPAPVREYLLVSDFDHTLTFDDSGVVLSRLLGATDFERRDDVGIPMPPNTLVQCKSFPAAAHDFPEIKYAGGDLQVSQR